jgi:hypothetical protein
MESDLWHELGLGMAKRWHANRVESHETSPGFPDVNYCISYNGAEGNLELKDGSKKVMPKMRNTQVRWHMFRYKAGGRSFIFSKIMNNDTGDNVYMLHLGKFALDMCMHRNYKYWYATATIMYINHINFEHLARILGEPS